MQSDGVVPMRPKVTCKVRIMVGRGVGMGPGKADMLRAIRDTRSINAAGKEFGMSYRRAWLLVEEMNFRRPGGARPARLRLGLAAPR